MAEAIPLKNYFGLELAKKLGKKVKEVYPEFNFNSYIKYIKKDIEPLELNARCELIADGLRKYLPSSYSNAIDILISILGPPLESHEGMFIHGSMWYPLGMFVKKYGQDDLETSLKAVYEITQRNTAEFAVRPLIEKYPDEVLKIFRKWANDKSFHVRRLTSEGLRPRLPWAGRLTVFKDEPERVIEILELLRKDESDFVRKSVANHLNDILKDNRAAGMKVLKRWSKEKHPATNKIIKHAMRNLIKEGNPEAMKMMGYDNKTKINVSKLALPRKVKNGEKMEFSFALSCDKPANVMVDYVMHFARKGGKSNAKVFKIGEKRIGKEISELRKSHSFKKVTTRVYYPGRHRLEIQVNGAVLAGKDFDLI